MTNEIFPGRVGLQQRVFPEYRVQLVDALAACCQGGLSLFAGKPLARENIITGERTQIARFVPARNRHFFSPDSPIYQCWQGGITEWLESWQPEALIVEANPRIRSNRFAIDWMQSRRRPVVGWGLGAPPISGLMGYWREKVRVQFLRSLDAVVAYSQRGAEEYRRLGFPPGRVFVAYNAVARKPQLHPQPRPMIGQQPINVLFVGRLQARKRVDNLLRACAALPDGLQPNLVIVGDGPSRVDLERLASSIYPNAEFVGARSGLDLEVYYKNADLFVLPGTGGLAVQQAMAYGLPVIVAQGDGTQEDLVRPENGWSVAADDPDALASALADAQSDLGRLRQMGTASFQIILQEVNLEAMVSVFINALTSVREKSGGW